MLQFSSDTNYPELVQILQVQGELLYKTASLQMSAPLLTIWLTDSVFPTAPSGEIIHEKDSQNPERHYIYNYSSNIKDTHRARDGRDAGFLCPLPMESECISMSYQ